MSHHRLHSSAPFGVKVLAVLTALDGALSALHAMGRLADGVLALAVMLAVVGLVDLALAYGLWQLEPYAYTLGLAVFGLGAVLDLSSGDPHGAVLSVVTISMLYHYRDLYRG